MRWVHKFSLILVMVVSLTGANGVQAVMLPPGGDDDGSLLSVTEVSARNVERRILEETTIQGVTLTPSDAADMLHDVMVSCCNIIADEKKLSMQERKIEWFSTSLFGLTLSLFERTPPWSVWSSAVGGDEWGSTSRMQPVSASPPSAMLFVPAVLGLLGVFFRERPSGVRSECESSAQPDESSAVVSTCMFLLSPDLVFINGIRESLNRVGCTIRFVMTVEEALRLAEHQSPTVVLVDHRVSAWDMLRTHPALTHTPIMTLIPVGSEYTDEHGISDLERGADGIHDFRDGQRLFTAKVGAYLRRAGHAVTSRAVYQVGAVHLDADHHKVTIAGQQLLLSAKPFAILKMLMEAPSRVFSRSELVDRVWGPQFAIGEHTLDVHVHALRQQLDRDPDRRCQLLTIKGVGFKLKSMEPGEPSFKDAVGRTAYPLVAGRTAGLRSAGNLQSQSDNNPPQCQPSSHRVSTVKSIARRRSGRMSRTPETAGHFSRAALAG